MSPLTPKLIMSGIFGLIYGLLSYVSLLLMDDPEPGRFALIMGLTAFAVMLLIMLINDSRMVRRYNKAEKSLPGEPVFRVGVNLREDRRVVSVTAYLYADEMILLNVRKREPVMTHIRRDEVKHIAMDSPVQLDLTMSDGRALSLLTPYMEDLTRELRKMGWLISDQTK